MIEECDKESQSFTRLSIADVSRENSGKWHFSLENAAGTKSSFVNLKVLDVPGPVTMFKSDESLKIRLL